MYTGTGAYLLTLIKVVTMRSSKPKSNDDNNRIVYVLECENNKFYVGKTTNVKRRLIAHKKGSGSSWTRLHKPIKVFKEYKNCDAFDEDKYTKTYMSEYGIDNVRGGSYSQIKLEDDQMKILTKELRSSKDQCLKCGKKGHFIQKCFASTWDCIKCTYSNLNSLSSCSMCDTINPMASSSINIQSKSSNMLSKKRKIKSTNSNAKRFQYKKGSYKCTRTCDTDKDDDLVTNSETYDDDGSTTDNDTDEDGQSDSDTSENTNSATDNDANDDDDEDDSETDVDSITTSDTDEDDDYY
ncbi:unnamed protein product [Didymodactylos carnosus]|uniref:Uncharacterized protein n=1 Tax=Didymodactylos carnosus TaxID=1234261 RepID=A0A814ZGJ2_9BILA|nr:unnamed protein product [Didymodactylos carnosus]CAF4006893.1 unnamed protein product [Didymodactylos carnosus]